MLRRSSRHLKDFGALPTLACRRRVVVTGLGCVTPLGCTVEDTWAGLLDAASGGRSLEEAPYFFPTYVNEEKKAKIIAALPCRVGCPVLTPRSLQEHAKGKDPFAPTNAEPRYTRFAKFAANAAMKDSGLSIVAENGSAPSTAESGTVKTNASVDATRIGVSVGIGMTPLHDVGEVAHHLYDPAADTPRYNKISPYFVPKILANMTAGGISLDLGARGPLLSTVSACATGGHCIGDGARAIQLGHADVMICGAAEAAINAVGIAGFARMRALASAYNSTPASASRPFDQTRDGFVMGEGSGIVILEDLEHALARNARIYAELRGFGASGDGHHLTSPRPDGSGGAQALLAALADGGVVLEQIGYVNAHATSTPVGDGIELEALTRVFGPSRRGAAPLVVSSSKGSLGHLLGAAGAVEAIATILALHHRVLPPTANLTQKIDHDAGVVELNTEAKDAPDIAAAASSSFGFGGTNAALVFVRAPTA
jgi:3-oxoacyl-[acyl-carrier-protein] synthase II